MRIYNVNILGEVIVAERPENATPPLPKPFHPILTRGSHLGSEFQSIKSRKGLTTPGDNTKMRGVRVVESSNTDRISKAGGSTNLKKKNIQLMKKRTITFYDL